MEPISFILTVASLGASVWAVVTANNAKSAVSNAISISESQDDIAEIEEILRKLSKAKNSSLIWIEGAPSKTQMGRDQRNELQDVRVALDAVRTWVPVNLNEDKSQALESNVGDLQDYCDKIGDAANNENHWNGVVSSAQSLERLLKEHRRTLRGQITQLAG